VALSGRQMKIVGFIHANGSVKSNDLVLLFRISRQAALKELAQMVGQNLIRPEGKGRATRYVMV
jgi:DeoR/GlpR family transcriptional regulator of sugar metabolism